MVICIALTERLGMTLRFYKAFHISYRKEPSTCKTLKKKKKWQGEGGTPMQKARKFVRKQGLPGLVLHLTSGEEPGQFLALYHHRQSQSVFQNRMETRSEARRLCRFSQQAAMETLTLLSCFHPFDSIFFLSSFPYVGLESIQPSTPKSRGQDDT